MGKLAVRDGLGSSVACDTVDFVAVRYWQDARQPVGSRVAVVAPRGLAWRA